MSHPMLELRGIFPPIPTPFDQAGNIDFEALTSHIRFLQAFHLAGYVILGSNGEAVHLTMNERIALLEASRALIPQDRLLIAGTGCLSTRETIELSRRAEGCGVDAVLVLPPSYYRGRMTRQALVQHFHAIADAVNIPLIVYNMPACTGMDLDAETIAAIAEHPKIIGLKDSGGNIVKMGSLHQLLGDAFQILAGSASFLLPALSVGAVGGVLALANIAPAQCLAVYDHTHAGQWDEARRMQIQLIEANMAVTSRWGVAGLKAAMALLGLPSSHVRLPLLDLEPSDQHLLRSILMSSQILISER